VTALGAFNLHLWQSSNLLFFSADDDDVLLLRFYWQDTPFGFPSLVFATWATQDDRLGLLDRNEPRSTFWTESQSFADPPPRVSASLLKHSEEATATSIVI